MRVFVRYVHLYVRLCSLCTRVRVCLCAFLPVHVCTHFFLYKNIVYKNIKAVVCAKVKNMLRISPVLVEHTYRKSY